MIVLLNVVLLVVSIYVTIGLAFAIRWTFDPMWFAMMKAKLLDGCGPRFEAYFTERTLHWIFVITLTGMWPRLVRNLLRSGQRFW